MLDCRDVTLRFGGTAALADISLRLAPGELLGLIGPNGSGKSTLLNVLSGFYRPDSGQVELEGRDLTGRSPREIRRLGVGRTFQSLRLLDELDLVENVLVGLHPFFADGPGVSWVTAAVGGRAARRREREATERARAALETVGLAGRERQAAGSLSYGLRKRLELARLLVGEPRVMLLDEPMAGLGSHEVRDLLALLRERATSAGAGMILVEHDLELVLEFSDRVAVLDAGRKIADGTPAEIAADPRVAEAYVGVQH